MSDSGKKENSAPTDPIPRHLLLTTLPVRIILPVALTIGLFILTIFLLIIPMLEKNMMDGKREGIMHLTESAWSTLNFYFQEAQKGLISQNEARQRAVRRLQQLRYGPEQEDYFWINDMTPRIIMHPYRPDLEGKDVSNFMDPAGKKLFVEMVKTVRADRAGYVDYLWQWKGDAAKIVPKISYVKAFEPWNWIIGTGIYVEDVGQEIRAITRHLIYACSGIMLLFLLVSGYIIWQGARTEKERIRAMAQSSLRERQLIQADKMTSLGILVAGVAHEINNPATSLMLNAPNLRRAWNAFVPVLDTHFADQPDARVCNMPYPNLAARITMMLSGIEDSSARIKRIIDELKDFARPGQTDMDSVVDVNQLVEKSLDLTHSIIKKATRHLTVELEAHLPPIRGNPQKLQQVIINLLVNAGQALEHPDQSIRVKTSKTRDAQFVVVAVSDTGPGVLPEDLKKMKDPFFTTRRDDGGTGLGLSISEKIVSDHAGMLEFDSEYGNGLTARILLPADSGSGNS